MSQATLADLSQQAIRNLLTNFVHGTAAVVAGTTSTLTNGAVHATVNGQAYLKAAGSNVAVTTLPDIQAANTTCYYLVMANAVAASSATSFYYVKGAEVLTANTTALAAQRMPTIPDVGAVAAVIKVVSTATFQCGTTAWGTGNTATFASTNALISYDPANLTFA